MVFGQNRGSGRPQAVNRVSWSLLGLSWGPLGPFWGLSGVFLASWGLISAAWGPFLGFLKPFLGSWGLFALLWASRNRVLHLEGCFAPPPACGPIGPVPSSHGPRSDPAGRLHAASPRRSRKGAITSAAPLTSAQPLNCRAGHKEGAAVVRPVGVFDPPPPSAEGEQGVLDHAKSKGQNLPILQSFNFNRRRPRGEPLPPPLL